MLYKCHFLLQLKSLLPVFLMFSVAFMAQQNGDAGELRSQQSEVEQDGVEQGQRQSGPVITPQEREAAIKAARQQEISRELEVRQQAIAELQSEQGIYHPGLIEAFSDMARLQIEIEDYDGATTSLTDALQIARINTGLYSKQQLPLIGGLIEQNLRLGDWQQVDNLVHLDHHIASRVFDLKGEDYLAAADDYGRWKLRVTRENLLGLNSQGLMSNTRELSEFYSRLLFNLESADGVETDALLNLLEGKSQADISLARSVASTPYTYFQGTANRYINETRCENRRSANGQVVRRCFNVQVENPRYRQSQRDAKRFLLNRHISEIDRVIEQMEMISQGDKTLSAPKRQQLQVQIREIRAEAQQVRRADMRGGVF